MTPCDVKGPESHYEAVLDLHEDKPVRPSLLLSLIAQYFFTYRIQSKICYNLMVTRAHPGSGTLLRFL